MGPRQNEYTVTELLTQVDAEATGWLAHLDPVAKGKVYEMACPACAKREAYHFPGSTQIICRREKACGERTSLWDLLEGRMSGATRRDIYLTIAKAAGVDITTSREGHTSTTVQTAKTVVGLLRSCLEQSPAAWAYLTDERGYSAEDIANAGLGYYPGARWLQATCSRKGVDLGQLRDWGVLPDDPDAESPLAGRVVGFWRQPDGGLALWGRRLDGKDDYKYLFTAGLDKTRPYLYARPGGNTLPTVEGALDAHALRLMGVPACAVGGNRINLEQAKFLAQDGVRSVMFFADDGKAGYSGMLATIANCEAQGISTFFAITPEGEDDVDAMRRNGRESEAIALIDDARSGGSVLATAISAMADGRHESYADARQLLPTVAQLTAPSRLAYDAYMRAQGLKPPSPEVDALRAMATLLDEGLALDIATDHVARRHGVRIRME